MLFLTSLTLASSPWLTYLNADNARGRTDQLRSLGERVELLREQVALLLGRLPRLRRHLELGGEAGLKLGAVPLVGRLLLEERLLELGDELLHLGRGGLEPEAVARGIERAVNLAHGLLRER